MTTKITYFAYDLSDPAVQRRTHMLSLGNATVTIIGFRRTPDVPKIEHAAKVIDLGRTRDARLVERVLSVVRAYIGLKRMADHIRNADVILARNLEMLLLANKARDRYAPEAQLVYESLDIHSKLLSDRLDGRLLRTLESRLWRHVSLLLTSSPAFVRYYFEPKGFRGRVRLVENKVLINEPVKTSLPRPSDGPPWRIGWFGLIRCRRSLEILGSLADACNGNIEIIIRGRPSPAVFPDFAAAISRFSHVRYEGLYRYPDDLSRIYGEVHFSWAVDFYEEGKNSSWLLPNRLYESGLFNIVPIALAHVETGRWLAERGIGVILTDNTEQELSEFFNNLTHNTYQELVQSVSQRSRGDFRIDKQACEDLVTAMRLSA